MSFARADKDMPVRQSLVQVTERDEKGDGCVVRRVTEEIDGRRVVFIKHIIETRF